MSKPNKRLSQGQSATTSIMKVAGVIGATALIAAALFFSIEGIEDDDDEDGCDSCTITISGTNNTNYTLTNGAVFCVQAGATYTGNLQRNSGNDEVIICNHGTISGSSMSFNKGDNTIENHGTMTNVTVQFNSSTDDNRFNNYAGASASFSTLNLYSNDTEFHNHGAVTSGSIILSSGASFRNHPTGVVNSGNVEANSNTEYRNEGTWTVTGNVQVNSNGEFRNEGDMTVSGNVENNNDFESSGTLSVGGNFTINGSAETDLAGTAAITGNLTVNKDLEQSGLLTIGGNMTVNGSGDVEINGNVFVDGNLTNAGDIHGKDPATGLYGTIQIQGVTTQYGGGSLNDNLDVCDTGHPSGGMDTNWGSADPTVTYCVHTAASLPVEWLGFEAEPSEQGVELFWMTAIESNNDFFTVERSAESSGFTPVLVVDGAGNSDMPVEYRITDPTPPSGRLYYRIRQTDFDGKTSFSNQVEVTFEVEAASVRVYPNPAKDLINVDLLSNSQETVLIRILNLQGQEMQAERVEAQAGKTNWQGQIGSMPAGMYLLQVQRSGQSRPETVRFVKQ